ncbi:hypothetical protein [Olivibacter sp. XZL3]|uniref:hypothetical protein n=1 Tax=Olivibacter sp. XZL3 TaxID=1735116 RepID=UPI0010649FA2|nr:hypothetical protein [Olivibacter sp. XZL3]
MGKKDQSTNSKREEIKKSIEKLKAFKLTEAAEDDDIEIDGDRITGGKKDTTVDTHWPTTGNANN